MTSLISFILGVVFKTAITITTDFKKNDIWSIFIAFGFSAYILIRSLAEDWPIQSSVMFCVITFTTIISFTFKDRILQEITAKDNLLYSLAIFYLIETNTENVFYNHYGFKLTVLFYLFLSLISLVRGDRIKKHYQILLYIFFIISNIIILSSFFNYGKFLLILCNDCAVNSLDLISGFLIGYLFFSLISNILYILYFIPIPLSRSEKFKQRILSIKKHASDLEEKYIERKVNMKDITLLAMAIFLFLSNYYYQYLNNLSLVSYVLVLSGLVTSNNDKQVPSPNNTYQA